MSYRSDWHLFSQGLEIETGIAAVFTLPKISFCRLPIVQARYSTKIRSYWLCWVLKISKGAIHYSIVLHIRKTAQHKFSATFHATPLFFLPTLIMVYHLPAPDSTKGGVGSPHPHSWKDKGFNSSPWAHLPKQKSVCKVTQQHVLQ